MVHLQKQQHLLAHFQGSMFTYKVTLKPQHSLLALSSLPALSLPMYLNCVRVGICIETTKLAVDYITVENFFSVRIVRSYSIEHAHSCRF